MGYDGAMIIVHGLGLLLLIAAFLGGAAEIAARGSMADPSWFLSARETWEHLWPQSLAIARQAVGPGLWTGLVEPALAPPFWMLFGAPGAALAWVGRPRHHDIEGPDEDSMFLYDRLVERAREEGYLDEPGDGPQHFNLEEDADREGDDLAPTQHGELPSDDEGDDSAPTEHGYDPPEPEDAKAWAELDDGRGQDGNAGRQAEGGRATPFSVPKPPRPGLGAWVPPGGDGGEK